MTRFNRLEHRLWFAVLEEHSDYTVLRFRRWVPCRLALIAMRALAWRLHVPVHRSRDIARLFVIMLPYRHLRPARRSVHVALRDYASDPPEATDA